MSKEVHPGADVEQRSTVQFQCTALRGDMFPMTYLFQKHSMLAKSAPIDVTEASSTMKEQESFDASYDAFISACFELLSPLLSCC